VLTFKIMIVLLGRKISIKDRMLVQGERGSISFDQTMDLIKNSFSFSSASIDGKYMIDNVTCHCF
jgi:hypothetical protein